MTDLAAAIRALVDLPTDELARAVDGARDDQAAAARLHAWLAARRAAAAATPGG